MPSCALGVGVNRRSKSPRLAVNSHNVRTATEYGIVKWYSIKAALRRVGQNAIMQGSPSRTVQPRNPLHGLTMEAIVTALEAHYGWAELGMRIPVRCFTHEPSV